MTIRPHFVSPFGRRCNVGGAAGIGQAQLVLQAIRGVGSGAKVVKFGVGTMWLLILLTYPLLSLSTMLGSPPYARLAMGFEATPDGRLYAFGGDPATNSGFRQDLYAYTPSSNTWAALSPTGSSPSARYGMGFAATPDGRLYVFGGFADGDPPAAYRGDLYVYTPSSNTWAALFPTGSSPSARFFLGFAATPDGLLYAFGGANADYRQDFYAYTPSSNTWAALSPTGSAPSARAVMGFAATPDGLLYVFGGGNAVLQFQDLYAYTPSSNTWTALFPTGASPPARQGMGFTATQDGQLFVFGGNTISEQYQDLYVYTPSSNTWAALFPTGSSPSTRYGMGFAATPDDRLYVFGGYTIVPGYTGPVGDLFLLDKTAGTWINCGSTDGSCIVCAAGSYAGPSNCVPCPAGSYYAATGAISAWNCTLCVVGSYSNFSGATSVGTCTACDTGSFSKTAGASACMPCRLTGSTDYHLSLPTCPSTAVSLPPVAYAGGPCDLPNLTWQEVTNRESVTAWTGGLGLMMTPEAQVWLCLLQANNQTNCGFKSTQILPSTASSSGFGKSTGSVPELACYVYLERDERFAYWGPNSILRLVTMAAISLY